MNKNEIKKWLDENFPEIWGMSFKEFEEKISNPNMKNLVNELRSKFGTRNRRGCS